MVFKSVLIVKLNEKGASYDKKFDPKQQQLCYNMFYIETQLLHQRQGNYMIDNMLINVFPF